MLGDVWWNILCDFNGQTRRKPMYFKLRLAKEKRSLNLPPKLPAWTLLLYTILMIILPQQKQYFIRSQEPIKVFISKKYQNNTLMLSTNSSKNENTPVLWTSGSWTWNHPAFKRPQYMSVYIAVFIFYFYKNNYVLKAFIGYFHLSIYLVIITYPWSQF